MNILIWFCVFCCSFILSLYVFDSPTLYKNPPVSTRKASIYDLPDGASKSQINDYINDHIIPSNDFYCLRSVFEKENDSSDFVCKIFLTCIPVVLLVNSIRRHYLDEFGFGATVLICVAGVGACVLAGYILDRVYSRYWMIPEMEIDKEYIRKRLNTIEDSFHVGLEIAKENYMTAVYYSYCMKVKRTVQQRFALKSVVSGICTVIYVVFFMRNPYE